jgi:hypothetical protein
MSTGSAIRWGGWLVLLAGWGAICATAAGGRDPLELVPADSLLCWYGQPRPDLPPAATQPSTLQAVLEIGSRIAGRSLDGPAQLWVRGAELFTLTIRRPHALVLLDVRAKPIADGAQAKRVDALQCALIVQNRGETEPYLRLIQKAVNEQTSSATATLVTRSAGDWSYQELRDDRLPDWCTLAWGHMDGCFVLALGREVWPRIAAVAAGDAPALSRVPWYVAARQGPDALRGTFAERKPLIEIFVAAQEIQRRLDPLLDNRASAFFAAWQAEKLERAHWALGLTGRALFCVAHFQMDGQTTRRVYADPDVRIPRLLATVPDDAHYAIYHLPMDGFLRWFFGGLVSVQGPDMRHKIERVWANVQKQRGFDVEGGLLRHLGDYVVVHNDPPHPLRIPVALTTLIEIRDEPDDVRRTLDTMGAVFREALETPVEEGKAPLPWGLQRDSDGLWYLQLGPIAGPAWTVTDRYIVTSWSPVALREYLARLERRAGATASQPTTAP